MAVEDAEHVEQLAVEEPLEIRLAGRRFTLTMRTPGHDEELAAGFLFAEGFIDNVTELGEIRRVRDRKGAPEPNAIDIVLNVPADGLRARLKRNFVMSSSCGVCGKTSIDSIRRRVASPSDSAQVSAATLLALPAKLRAGQRVFVATGGLHGAAIFNLDGKCDAIREDVGRHNAVDKVVGYRVDERDGSAGASRDDGQWAAELRDCAEGRRGRSPDTCAVSAPSSLAVELANEIGTTLVGFLRDGSFNIYTRPDRIDGAAR